MSTLGFISNGVYQSGQGLSGSRVLNDISQASQQPPVTTVNHNHHDHRRRRPMDGKAKEDQVMSEVHLGCPPDSSGPHISHFTISISPDIDCWSECCELLKVGKDEEEEDVDGETPMCQTLTVDEDGDLVLTRRPYMSDHSLIVSIQHSITSSILTVGLQVWKAALLLSDFVLHKMLTSSEFDGVISLELGAGTGLVGMLLGHVAKEVFLTDHGDAILENCESNVQINSKVLKYQAGIHVRELDWMKSWPPSINLENSACHKRYSWRPLEIEEAENAIFLLAADVIYSDGLTEALFCTLETLMSLGSDKVLYLALEKRYNFSLDDLDVVANGYSCFRSYVREEGVNEEPKCGSTTSCFVGKCIDLSLVPQYIKEYERGNDVELWQIRYDKRGT